MNDLPSHSGLFQVFIHLFSLICCLQRIGFTTQDPDNGGVPVRALKCCSSPKYWILSAATVHHHGGKRKVNLNIEELNVGDSVGCRVTKDGSLEIFANGVSRGVGWENLPTAVPLWGFADVYGKTVKIKSEFCFGESLAHMQVTDIQAPSSLHSE